MTTTTNERENRVEKAIIAKVREMLHGLLDNDTYSGHILCMEEERIEQAILDVEDVLLDAMAGKESRVESAAPDLLAAFKAAVDRMEAVAAGIPIDRRHKRVSPATHVRHMAGHLAEHAKIARAAIAKAEAR